MSENTHYTAPASELLHALPLSPPLEEARCIYSEPELKNHYMHVLMKPLKPGQAPQTKFLVKELLYMPRTVYRILTRTISPIKGHDSSDEEIPATSAEETAATEHLKTQTATEEEPEIPQPEELEIAIPEVVMQLTDTPLPKPKDPFSRKQKFKADDFFSEHVFFEDYNPYNPARIRKRRF